MTPVKQTVRGKLGNCFAACVASILEVPIEQVPNHFKEDGTADGWLDLWNEFLHPFGFGIVWADFMFCRVPKGYAIAEMEVYNHDSNHAVVCLDGEMVHDPTGEDEFKFGRIIRWYIFTVLDAKVS